MARSLFASDVHLRPGDGKGWNPFFRFLEEDCDALYILGDLFDYWIGPNHLEGEDYRGVFEALREKSSRSKVFFIQGNRDYLVEGRFEKATGMKILGDRARIRLGTRTVLLAHGDFIYNTNPKYTAYRTMMRSKPIADLWLAVPAVVGKTLVRGYRKVSKLTTPTADWPAGAIAEGARPFFTQGADVLIAGHIHVPQHVSVEVGERRCEVYILGDWEGGTQDVVDHDGEAFHFAPWKC